MNAADYSVKDAAPAASEPGPGSENDVAPGGAPDTCAVELESTVAGAPEQAGFNPLSSASSGMNQLSVNEEDQAELDEKLQRLGPPVSSSASRERQLRQACVLLLKEIVVPDRGKAD